VRRRGEDREQFSWKESCLGVTRVRRSDPESRKQKRRKKTLTTVKKRNKAASETREKKRNNRKNGQGKQKNSEERRLQVDFLKMNERKNIPHSGGCGGRQLETKKINRGEKRAQKTILRFVLGDQAQGKTD